MPAYFSYIDTALRIIYINRESLLSLAEKDQLDKVMEQGETSQHFKQYFLRHYIKNQFQSDAGLNELMVHEIHHYFQSLYYPFLYYLNWIEFDNLIHLRNLIKKDETECFAIKDIQLIGQFRNNFTYTSQKFHLYWDSDRLLVKLPEAHTPSREVFSLYDFLEDVTTLFQYKITKVAPGAEDFYTFMQNPANKGYRRLYRFLVKQIGKQFTYDLLPILVQVAFTTTEPIGAFCNAMSFINYNLPHYDQFSTAYVVEFLLGKLRAAWGDYEIEPVDDMFVQELPVKVLTHASIEKLIAFSYQQDEFFHYPLSLHTRKFKDMLRENPPLIYHLIDINKKKFEYLLQNFEPMATHFFFQELNGRNSAVFIGQDYENAATPQGAPYDYYLKELIKIKEIIQALLTDVQQHVPANCHHLHCPYYDLGLCKKWNSIPQRAKDCGFPAWFTYIFHRSINLKEFTLDKVSREVADQNWEAYNKRSHQGRRFNYITGDDGYVVTIGISDFTHAEKANMFADLLKHLIEEKHETNANLCSKITLDFYGFDDDPQPVFANQAVSKWMKETLRQVPEFLCYINFNTTVDHCFILLPAFISHQLQADRHGNFRVYYDEVDRQRFLMDQVVIFRKFNEKYPEADTGLLMQTLNKLINGN